MKFFACTVLMVAAAYAGETRDKRGIFGESLLGSHLGYGSSLSYSLPLSYSSYAPSYSSYASYAPSYTSGLYSGYNSLSSYSTPTIIKSAPIISTPTIIKSAPILSAPAILNSAPLYSEPLISAPAYIKSAPLLDDTYIKSAPLLDHTYIKAAPIIEDNSYLHEPSYAKIIKVAPKYSTGWW